MVKKPQKMPDQTNPNGGFMNALPAISTAAGAAGSIIGPIAQFFQNKQNRKYYLRDRDYNNWYNSPEQQMARLKDAGLNPNLVYGSGNAITTASQPAKMDQPAPKPEFDALQRGLYQWQDYALKEAKINQIEKLANLAVENTLMAREKTEGIARANRMGESLFDTQVSMVEERLRSQKLANTGQAYTNQLRLQEWEIKELMKEPNLAKALTDIAYTKAKTMVIPAQIDNLIASTKNLVSSKEFRDLNADQLRMVKDDMHQLLLNQVKESEGRRSLNDTQSVLNRIKARWKEGGMSETIISDLIGILGRR